MGVGNMSNPIYGFTLADKANISTLYGEFHRRYHTLDHVHACMYEYEQYLKDTKSEFKMSIHYAIWFHDIVYNPRASNGDNEKESASVFLAWALDHELDGQLQSQVQRMTLATAKHKHEWETPETWTFLDIDLSILGQRPDVYNEYKADIREEYRFVPTKDYTKGRIAVLQSFLNRPRIYMTDYFHQKYEATARKNIASEITYLEKTGS